MALVGSIGLSGALSAKVTSGGASVVWSWVDLATVVGEAAIGSTESLSNELVDEEIDFISVLEDHLLSLLLEDWKSSVSVVEVFFPLSAFLNLKLVEFMAVSSKKIVNHVVHCVLLDFTVQTC